MLIDLVDILQKQRRLLFVVAFVSIDFWLLAVCGQILQTHRSDLLIRMHTIQTSAAEAKARSDAFADESLSGSMEYFVGTSEVTALRTTIAAADGIAKSEHALRTGLNVTVHGTGKALVAIVRAIGVVLFAIARIIGGSIVFVFRVLAFPFVMIGKGVAHIFGTASGLTHANLSSVIQPQNDKDIPVITAEQAQQATLIQENTVAVTPVKPTGSGGACDGGAGNGGYPMDWCDARMDTVRTVSYSNDRINRECTSYAYWYFTEIEGHKDFHVTGNANHWARTANYPAHAAPAVGAVAVETGGYYGHVAIVQALPGQNYEGKIVPEGFVLVSEMNYDWHGHFRYSYSPLGKFSAYIYP